MAAKAKARDKRHRPLAKKPGESSNRRRGKFALLRLVNEQGAVPYDQLLRFRCTGPALLAPTLEDLQDDDALGCARLLEGEQPWAWARPRGARLAGLDLPAYKPGFSRLAHTRAINEVRLDLKSRAPQGRWICERTLRTASHAGENIPDAVLEIGEERHAIEVELTRKRRSKVREIVARHLRRYDALLYFCGPETLGFIAGLDFVKDDLRVVVRPMPGPSHPIAPHERPGRVDRRGDRYRDRGRPTPLQIEALVRIAEQGIVPLDQLARFLAIADEEATPLADRLRGEGYVHLERPLVGEPAWLALTYRGACASGTGLRLSEVRLGALAMARATNEVRLLLAERAPQGRWLSRRRLAHRAPGHRPTQAPCRAASSASAPSATRSRSSCGEPTLRRWPPVCAAGVSNTTPSSASVRGPSGVVWPAYRRASGSVASSSRSCRPVRVAPRRRRSGGSLRRRGSLPSSTHRWGTGRAGSST